MSYLNAPNKEIKAALSNNGVFQHAGLLSDRDVSHLCFRLCVCNRWRTVPPISVLPMFPYDSEIMVRYSQEQAKPTKPTRWNDDWRRSGNIRISTEISLNAVPSPLWMISSSPLMAGAREWAFFFYWQNVPPFFRYHFNGETSSGIRSWFNYAAAESRSSFLITERRVFHNLLGRTVPSGVCRTKREAMASLLISLVEKNKPGQ